MGQRCVRFKANVFFALKPEAPPGVEAGVISRQTSSADFGPHGIDRAGRRDADVAHERRTAIAVAAHASSLVIDVDAGDAGKIGIAFQRKVRPIRRKRATRAASPARSSGKLMRRSVHVTFGGFRSMANG
jgi:hypothetical protein